MRRSEILLTSLLAGVVVSGAVWRGGALREAELNPVVVEEPLRAPASDPAASRATRIEGGAAASGQRLADINTATAGDLDAVRGIGPVLSQAIVANRDRHGPFRSMSDLSRVSGIGPSRVQALEDHFAVYPGAGGSVAHAQQISPQPDPGMVPAVPLAQTETLPGSAPFAPAMMEPRQSAGGGGRIDLNRASAEELETLPRIGKVLAERIVQYRQVNGPFRIPADIQKVSGIGPSTYEQIRDRIAAGP